MNDVRAALGLLTILPVRYGEGISSRALAYYPLMGCLIGILLLVANFLLHLTLPNLVAASLVVAFWAILTGGLHLDGFSDACDGLFAATTPERRLEILRDVHLGAFGAIGLFILLITKVAAVASMQGDAPLFLAPVLARWAMVYAAAFPLARKEGMAVLFASGLNKGVLFAATVLTVFFSSLFGRFGLVAFVAAVVLSSLVARLAVKRLGGLTGDIYGMVCESVEVGVLLVGSITI